MHKVSCDLPCYLTLSRGQRLLSYQFVQLWPPSYFHLILTIYFPAQFDLSFLIRVPRCNLHQPTCLFISQIVNPKQKKLCSLILNKKEQGRLYRYNAFFLFKVDENNYIKSIDGNVMTKKASLIYFMVNYAAEYQDELFKTSDLPSQSLVSTTVAIRVQSKKAVCERQTLSIPDPVKK